MDEIVMPDMTVIKALADERRYEMLRVLGDGQERCVCELAEQLGMSDALVSHHVSRLRDAGLVRTRRAGRWLHVRAEGEQLRSLAERLRGMCCPPKGDCCGSESASDG